MSQRQLFVGLVAEGSTDYNFLLPIIKETLSYIGYDCYGQIDFYVEPILPNKSGKTTKAYILEAAQQGLVTYGIDLLIVHLDADEDKPDRALEERFKPAKAELETLDASDYCQNLLPLIPVHETEAWMLANTDVLLRTIGASKQLSPYTQAKLGLAPEQHTDPKAVLADILREERAYLPKKQRGSLSMEVLYGLLGGRLRIQDLQGLASFQAFEMALRQALKVQGLHP